ncbi:hypothetical protein L1049_018036 [Liquidambar formosana]|uniref:Uncharacterized protein n=1 Tax=Liquidambar formosana TaxID=63359 RepID=A0AAP0NNB5_LIQFO
MGTRGVIGDKWSMRVLWMCAIGSAISLYMVAVERQIQNRERMMAESLKAMESGADSGEEDGSPSNPLVKGSKGNFELIRYRVHLDKNQARDKMSRFVTRQPRMNLRATQ